MGRTNASVVVRQIARKMYETDGVEKGNNDVAWTMNITKW